MHPVSYAGREPEFLPFSPATGTASISPGGNPFQPKKGAALAERIVNFAERYRSEVRRISVARLLRLCGFAPSGSSGRRRLNGEAAIEKFPLASADALLHYIAGEFNVPASEAWSYFTDARVRIASRFADIEFGKFVHLNLDNFDAHCQLVNSHRDRRAYRVHVGDVPADLLVGAIQRAVIRVQAKINGWSPDTRRAEEEIAASMSFRWMANGGLPGQQIVILSSAARRTLSQLDAEQRSILWESLYRDEVAIRGVKIGVLDESLLSPIDRENLSGIQWARREGDDLIMVRLNQISPRLVYVRGGLSTNAVRRADYWLKLLHSAVNATPHGLSTGASLEQVYHLIMSPAPAV